MTARLVLMGALGLGVAALANGTFMVVAPDSWYWLVPGVPGRGPFNQHFIRDIGFLYALIGVTFIWGAIYTEGRKWTWLAASGWLVSHAVFHIWEVVVGICGPASLAQDFAGVTLPALLGLGLTWASFRCEPGG